MATLAPALAFDSVFRSLGSKGRFQRLEHEDIVFLWGSIHKTVWDQAWDARRCCKPAQELMVMKQNARDHL